jgi:hypothetical protein
MGCLLTTPFIQRQLQAPIVESENESESAIWLWGDLFGWEKLLYMSTASTWFTHNCYNRKVGSRLRVQPDLTSLPTLWVLLQPPLSLTMCTLTHSSVSTSKPLSHSAIQVTFVTWASIYSWQQTAGKSIWSTARKTLRHNLSKGLSKLVKPSLYSEGYSHCTCSSYLCRLVHAPSWCWMKNWIYMGCVINMDHKIYLWIYIHAKFNVNHIYCHTTIVNVQM